MKGPARARTTWTPLVLALGTLLLGCSGGGGGSVRTGTAPSIELSDLESDAIVCGLDAGNPYLEEYPDLVGCTGEVVQEHTIAWLAPRRLA